MKSRLLYLIDSHVVSSGEAAYNRLVLYYTHQGKEISNNAFATKPGPLGQPWRLHGFDVRILDASASRLQLGALITLIIPGPPNHGNLTLLEGLNGQCAYVSDYGFPVDFGFGLAIWPASLAAGDVVYVRAHYRIDPERWQP